LTKLERSILVFHEPGEAACAHNPESKRTGATMRKLISICLVFTVATASLGALSAASASAAAGDFDLACNQNTPCTWHGQQIATHTFTIRINAGALSCTTTTFLASTRAAEGGTAVLTESGAADWAIHTLKAKTTHTGCTFLGQTATVTTSGCLDTFTATSKTGGTVVFSCEAGKEVEIEATTSKCKIKIPAQTPINNAVDFAAGEAEGKKDVTLTETIGTEIPVKGAKSGIKYTTTGGACGEGGENGSIRGAVTLKAYSSSVIEPATQISGTIVETQANGKIK
jgi:hypothetical protein